jgi:hypothetical protein
MAELYVAVGDRIAAPRARSRPPVGKGATVAVAEHVLNRVRNH